MTARRVYISTTIPYVNARPHLGFALELVQADVLARHARLAGHQVRLQTGTDDNSLKNVLAARAAGISPAELTARNAAAFAALREPLALSADDFIRTGTDPRHRPGAERLWQACAARGDLYRRPYEGLYCTGCEQFYEPAELPRGRCPEHGTPPEQVREQNWFFRLSRYGPALTALVSSGQLRIEPAAKRREVLGFLRQGLADISVSRPAARARGWGIGVPGDPGQVIYVWFDALANYISALGYGTGGADYRAWWTGADQRLHLLGKGVLKFHAVYWPAFLLSAGEPLPTALWVHDYLTAGGSKISKSAAPDPAGTDPAVLAARFGTDAVRWWLLREVPRTGDADFSPGRLAARADEELAGGAANLVSRVVALVHRYRDGAVPAAAVTLSGLADTTRCTTGAPGRGEDPAAALGRACAGAPAAIAAALADFDFRAATEAALRIVTEGNRYLEAQRPWERARAERNGEPGQQVSVVLATAVAACRTLGAELRPFLPGLAERILAACGDPAGTLPPRQPLFPRLRPAAASVRG